MTAMRIASGSIQKVDLSSSVKKLMMNETIEAAIRICSVKSSRASIRSDRKP